MKRKIALIIVLVLICVSGLSACQASGYEKVLNSFCDALNERDVAALKSLFFVEYDGITQDTIDALYNYADARVNDTLALDQLLSDAEETALETDADFDLTESNFEYSDLRSIVVESKDIIAFYTEYLGVGVQQVISGVFEYTESKPSFGVSISVPDYSWEPGEDETEEDRPNVVVTMDEMQDWKYTATIDLIKVDGTWYIFYMGTENMSRISE